jgi:TonB family protein
MPDALLVDDDEPFLAALAEAVSRENFATRTATSLAGALSALAGGTPDVVLIDLHLPDGNGLELLEHLSAFPTTEVVLITGQASVDTAVEALRRGVSDYLVKPVDLARVKTVLANVSRTRDLKMLASSLPWTRRTNRDGLPVGFGRYEAEAEIGEGAMGRVYRCRDPLVGRPVAVKTVKSEYLSGDTREDYLNRFRREAQAAGTLSHPGIVSIFDVGEDYIVMEYVEGTTLHHLLRDQRALDFSSALRVLAPLAEALDHAHQVGVIHRDIKPANIMVQPDGRPKLMDFGVARLDSSTATRTGHVFGSPSYMAPEQILGGELTARADLFSFAVVAYEALTGQRPFQGDSVAAIVYRVAHEAPPAASSLNHALPTACDAVFAKALAKKRDERYPDATSFVSALVSAESGTEHPDLSPDPLLESLVEFGPQPEPLEEAPPVAAAVTALPVPEPVPARRAAYPRPRLGLLGAVAALAVLVALFGFLIARPAPSGPGATGPLRIETQPPGIPVWIDGRPVGLSPLSLAVGPGSHQVRVFQDGYAPAELTLQLVPGTTAAPLRFVMAPLPPTLLAQAGALAAPSPAISSTSSGSSVAVADMPASEAPVRRADAAAEPRARRGTKAGEAFWTPVQPRPGSTVATPAPAEVATAPSASYTRAPRRVVGDMPRYPDDARRLGLSGSVLLDMVVSETGRPEQVRVMESAGSLLDETVLAAVAGWRFEPAERDGVKVAVHWPYRHTFTNR